MNDTYRLTDRGIRQKLLREGAWTPDSLLCTMIFGLGIGLLGHAPLWPLMAINSAFVLLHLKSLRHLPRLKGNWQDFEVTVETDRVVVRRHGLLESSASRSEIKKISEFRGNCLWIHTAPHGFSLPSVVSGYKQLRATLATWTIIERKRSLPLWMYIGWPAAVAMFITALLVRSPYVFFPLLIFTGFYLLRLAQSSIRQWQTDGWKWLRTIEAGRIKDPFWIPAIPFIMLLLLVMKSLWMFS
jgi:hypothetical protein